MNVFIVLIREEYDQYEVYFPYPIITGMTYEQAKGWLIDLADAACEWLNMDGRKQRYISEPVFELGTYKLGVHQITQHDGTRYRPDPPEVLGLDEWLLRANINANREKHLL